MAEELKSEPKAESKSQSWWQTLPGILTATAGIITAVAGLIVALHQAGILGGAEKLTSQQPSNEIVKPAKVATPPVVAETTPDAAKSTANDHTAQYSLAFPSGTQVSIGEATYKVLAAQVDRRNTENLSLKLSIRMTNNGRFDANFWDRSFRLLVDGEPRAPIGDLNELVAAQSAKEGEVVFEIPDTAKSVVLQVGEPGKETTKIPLDLKLANS